MAYLHDLMLSGLPREGSTVIVGSCGPFRRPHWPVGERVVCESGRMLDHGLTASLRKRDARLWQPYAEDLLADDWETCGRAQGGDNG